MKEIFERIKDLISLLTNEFSKVGIITEIVDLLLVIGFISGLLFVLSKKFKVKNIIIGLLFILFAFLIAYSFDLTIMLIILKYILFWFPGVLLIIYNQEIRHIFDKNFHAMSSSKNFTSEEEKKRVINIITNAISYLSVRRIGALITIEGKDSLDSIIEKSIIINSDLSQELLETLFYVGTITHDGAVIIRKDKIMCAGAYLPSTDRYDIPKNLGTRHRAAIGISERCDAVTIVVSEETGNISLTVNGGIEIGITEDKLVELLEQYLIVK